jgi:hypothetical protein
MLKVSELSERLRLTLYPVPRWVDIVSCELDLTEPKTRALLDALEAAGKVVTFNDTEGILRVAHAGNWTPSTGERTP